MLHMIPAYEFRRRAREAMKPVMPILLIVALIAAMPSLIQNAVTLIADADPNSLLSLFSNRLMQIMENPSLSEEQIASAVYAAQDEYLQAMNTFLQEKGLLIALLSAMVVIVSPVLTLGLINALLHALRKEDFTAAIALSRVKYLLKVIGLELLFALKVFLWMLPGVALMVASFFLPEGLMVTARIAGFIAAVVMGAVASYRYAMAIYVMADEPHTSIRACIRRSKEIMQRRKMELFSLEISFIGWRLLLSLVQTTLMGFGAVIGLTLGMFASLFLTVYTNCAQAAFYQEYGVGPVAAQEAPEAEELN